MYQEYIATANRLFIRDGKFTIGKVLNVHLSQRTTKTIANFLCKIPGVGSRKHQERRAHKKLAELEQAGKLLAVVTQNIDGLHQAAGSEQVYELHGSVHRNYCEKCGKFYDLDHILHTTGVPRCDCGGVIKPDVVLYEEALNDRVIDGAVNAIAQADLLIVGGTSLNVWPAAGLINYFRGDRLALINKSPVARDLAAGLVITDPIGEVLSQL